jgi:aminobenzoyl-glutamate utilization protein B
MKNADAVWDLLEAKRERFFVLSDRVWDTPETNYEEFRSSAEHARLLEAEGFRVSRGIAGMPTAVMGEAGEGGPVIAILGEFDALPGFSQAATPDKQAVAGMASGHACGHHLFGAASMSAAIAIKAWLQ